MSISQHPGLVLVERDLEARAMPQRFIVQHIQDRHCLTNVQGDRPALMRLDRHVASAAQTGTFASVYRCSPASFATARNSSGVSRGVPTKTSHPAFAVD